MTLALEKVGSFGTKFLSSPCSPVSWEIAHIYSLRFHVLEKGKRNSARLSYKRCSSFPCLPPFSSLFFHSFLPNFFLFNFLPLFSVLHFLPSFPCFSLSPFLNVFPSVSLSLLQRPHLSFSFSLSLVLINYLPFAWPYATHWEQAAPLYIVSIL